MIDGFLLNKKMIAQLNIWQLLAGLGIFLLGMNKIEQALEQLAGRAFKRFLRNFTNRALKAILAGVIVTALLQSSAVVSLMAVAFVGAGIIELRNAVGIILGANLGTTFTGWIVATLGFSLQADNLALPLIAIGGLMLAYFGKQKNIQETGRLLLGFGFMFFGLSFMKSSVAGWAAQFDISPFAEWSPFLLAPIGFALAALIQSSTAAMVIALSALSAGMLTLESAAAMAIGSDLGTTMTVLIGGFKGSPGKKRVAFSHFFFNLVVDAMALTFLFPLLQLVQWMIGNTNPLVTLVAFHSTFNLLGIAIFLPILPRYARFLEGRFLKGDRDVARYIREVPPAVPDAAVEALFKEIRHLLTRVFALHWRILKLPPELLPDKTHVNIPAPEQYEAIKSLEGEMMEFYSRLQQEHLDRSVIDQLHNADVAIRHAMGAAKDVKDIHHNFHEFEKSVNDDIAALIQVLTATQQAFYLELLPLLEKQPPREELSAKLEALKLLDKTNYHNFMHRMYPLIQQRKFSELEISTLFNVNRELHAGNKDLLEVFGALYVGPNASPIGQLR